MTIYDLPAILLDLQALKRGWLNGEGEAITQTAISKAEQLLTPHIYPTPEGGVSIETDHYDIIVHADGTVEVVT
jgi:hypothetical protein